MGAAVGQRRGPSGNGWGRGQITNCSCWHLSNGKCTPPNTRPPSGFPLGVASRERELRRPLWIAQLDLLVPSARQFGRGAPPRRAEGCLGLGFVGQRLMRVPLWEGNARYWYPFIEQPSQSLGLKPLHPSSSPVVSHVSPFWISCFMLFFGALVCWRR